MTKNVIGELVKLVHTHNLCMEAFQIGVFGCKGDADDPSAVDSESPSIPLEEMEKHWDDVDEAIRYAFSELPKITAESIATEEVAFDQMSWNPPVHRVLIGVKGQTPMAEPEIHCPYVPKKRKVLSSR